MKLAAIFQVNDRGDLLAVHKRAVLASQILERHSFRADRQPWCREAVPSSISIRASITFHEGDRKKALAFLASAESGLEAQDMTLYAAVVKRRRGLLLGEAGKDLVETAEMRMVQRRSNARIASKPSSFRASGTLSKPMGDMA